MILTSLLVSLKPNYVTQTTGLLGDRKRDKIATGIE